MLNLSLRTPLISADETFSSSLPRPPLPINHSSPLAVYCRNNPVYTSMAMRSRIATLSTIPACRNRSTTR